MAISQEFLDAVNSNNGLLTRIMLKDSMIVDPTLEQYNERIKYAAAHMPDLFDPYDGEELNYDVSAWTTDYMNQELVALVGNFSHERLDLLQKMVRHIYKDDVARIQQKRSTQRAAARSSGPARKQVGTGVAVVGAALAVAGVCTSHTVLLVGGVVVAAAGVAVILTDKE